MYVTSTQASPIKRHGHIAALCKHAGMYSSPFRTFENEIPIGELWMDQNQWYHLWVGAPPILEPR